MGIKNIFIETYGCASNKADSHMMAGLLNASGYAIVSNEAEADCLIINSCAVKSATENRIADRLRTLATSNKKIIITGCLTKVNPKRIKSALPQFAGMLDPLSIHKIGDLLEQIDSGKWNIILSTDLKIEKPLLPKLSNNKVIDIVKISDGCLSRCTFCATKLARGDLISYRPDYIRDAVKTTLSNGFKEIYLTSEDSSAYGKDIGTNIAELTQSIAQLEGNFLIRVGMMNPLHFNRTMASSLVNVYKKEKIFKFLHLCVQSGSNKVLSAMRRGYTREDFISYVKLFKDEIPKFTLQTDIIVGHPSEDDNAFKETVALIADVRPDAINLSKFYPRNGTTDALLEQLDPKLVNSRSKEIFEMSKRISLENNETKWLDWQGEVLVDEQIKPGTFMCRNNFYKLIIVKDDTDLLGKKIKVKINKAKSNFLIGDVL